MLASITGVEHVVASFRMAWGTCLTSIRICKFGQLLDKPNSGFICCVVFCVDQRPVGGRGLVCVSSWHVFLKSLDHQTSFIMLICGKQVQVNISTIVGRKHGFRPLLEVGVGLERVRKVAVGKE